MNSEDIKIINDMNPSACYYVCVEGEGGNKHLSNRLVATHWGRFFMRIGFSNASIDKVSNYILESANKNNLTHKEGAGVVRPDPEKFKKFYADYAKHLRKQFRNPFSRLTQTEAMIKMDKLKKIFNYEIGKYDKTNLIKDVDFTSKVEGGSSNEISNDFINKLNNYLKLKDFFKR
jgi:hypothetical protein